MTFDDAWVDEVGRGLKACRVFLWLPIYCQNLGFLYTPGILTVCYRALLRPNGPQSCLTSLNHDPQWRSKRYNQQSESTDPHCPDSDHGFCCLPCSQTPQHPLHATQTHLLRLLHREHGHGRFNRDSNIHLSHEPMRPTRKPLHANPAFTNKRVVASNPLYLDSNQ